jgi:hypothetical protein
MAREIRSADRRYTSHHDVRAAAVLIRLFIQREHGLSIRIFTLAVFALAATFGVAGKSQASERLADGLYAIEVYHEATQLPGGKRGGCMIVGNHGFDSIPSLYHWGGNYNGWGECGLSSNRQDLLQNGQAIWEVYTVTAPGYPSGYVIRNRGVIGHCLIRSANGYANRPSLYMWTGLIGGDARYCGFRNAQELLSNGQAVWRMNIRGGFGPAAQIVDTVRVLKAASGSLGFATPPAFPHTGGDPAHAGFVVQGHNPWWFMFVRMDS